MTRHSNNSHQDESAAQIKRLEKQYGKLENQIVPIRKELAKLIKKPVNTPEAQALVTTYEANLSNWGDRQAEIRGQIVSLQASQATSSHTHTAPPITGDKSAEEENEPDDDTNQENDQFVIHIPAAHELEEEDLYGNPSDRPGNQNIPERTPDNFTNNRHVNPRKRPTEDDQMGRRRGGLTIPIDELERMQARITYLENERERHSLRSHSTAGNRRSRSLIPHPNHDVGRPAATHVSTPSIGGVLNTPQPVGRVPAAVPIPP